MLCHELDLHRAFRGLAGGLAQVRRGESAASDPTDVMQEPDSEKTNGRSKYRAKFTSNKSLGGLHEGLLMADNC